MWLTPRRTRILGRWLLVPKKNWDEEPSSHFIFGTRSSSSQFFFGARVPKRYYETMCSYYVSYFWDEAKYVTFCYINGAWQRPRPKNKDIFFGHHFGVSIWDIFWGTRVLVPKTNWDEGSSSQKKIGTRLPCPSVFRERGFFACTQRDVCNDSRVCVETKCSGGCFGFA